VQHNTEHRANEERNERDTKAHKEHLWEACSELLIEKERTIEAEKEDNNKSK
jgi:hypothetical protein